MFYTNNLLYKCKIAENSIQMELWWTLASVSVILSVVWGTLTFIFHFIRKNLSAYRRRATTSLLSYTSVEITKTVWYLHKLTNRSLGSLFMSYLFFATCDSECKNIHLLFQISVPKYQIPAQSKISQWDALIPLDVQLQWSFL